MKRLYLLRHGDADHPPGSAFPSDAKRPLNEAGRLKLVRQAEGLKALGLAPDGIVTSPYLRTVQTAAIVAAAFGLEDAVIESDALAPGASLKEIRRAARLAGGESVLVVGHAPDLGMAVGALIGGAPIELGKGWLAWIELSAGDVQPGQGRLKALLPARLQAAAGA